ncbi:MAG: helix-turn-helix domain-containing protein [Gammaproteobacteria bacterium]
MTEITRLGARIRASRKAAGFKTSKAFIIKYKIPASTYSQHESGKRVPDDEALKYYSKVFDVSFTWLKTGEGHPYKKPLLIQNKVMNEELTDLKKSNATSSIKTELLISILEAILKSHQCNLSYRKIEKVVTESIEIYSDIISTASSSEAQKKILKSVLAEYRGS